jgi:hypothetical protein
MAAGLGLVALRLPGITEMGSALLLVTTTYFTIALMVGYMGPPPSDDKVDAAA